MLALCSSCHLVDETVDDGKDMEAIEALIGQNTLDVPLSLDQYMSFYDGPTRQVSISTEEERVRISMAALIPGKGSAGSHLPSQVPRRSATTELVHRPGKRT